ncbi:MAG: alpha/beta hydrolase [Deltaproteobacteria bacterium]|nr:alpha/beta hydrolase [Deltaproteobacteria bacterium]
MEPTTEKPQRATGLAAPRGWFTTSDGVRLGYRTGGNPDGPPMLFCYGLMCSSFHFTYQWEHFASRYRLLMLDYRGHHESEFPVAITTLSFPRLADDLGEFLEHLGERRPVHLVGHSMGVNVALELYERDARRVRSLTLMAGGATFPVRGRVGRQRVAFLNAMMKVIDGMFPRLADAIWRIQARAPGAEHFAGLVGFNTKLSKPDDIRRVVELMSGFSPRVFAQLLGEYIRHDRTDTLPRIAAPTLILSGEKDVAVPPFFQEQLYFKIPGSELVSIDGGSHCPQFDRPGEVNAAMESFLETHGAELRVF